MKPILLSALIIVLFAFKPTNEKNKDFVVISASKQTIFGGAPGSGISTLCSLKIKALRSFTLICDSAYADNRIARYYVIQRVVHPKDTLKVKKGTVLEILFSIKTESEMGGGDHQVKNPGSRETNPPIAGHKGIILRYYGGKCNYLSVNNVEKRDDIILP
jgi:hypothetical protein